MPKGKKKTEPDKKAVKTVIGRPSIYSDELAERICDLVATNSSGLKKLCSENDWMPRHVTINQWRWKKPGFSTQYAQAKVAQADLLAEECIEIADETSRDSILKSNREGEEYEVANSEWINRSRLRVDTRKWLASKLIPKVYGDAKRVEDLEGQNSALRSELTSIREELNAKHKKEY